MGHPKLRTRSLKLCGHHLLGLGRVRRGLLEQSCRSREVSFALVPEDARPSRPSTGAGTNIGSSTALGGRSVPASGEIAGLRVEIAEVRAEVAQLRERMAHLEGLLEGLREAISGRVKAS